jgi:hypothetical protein
MAWPLAIAAGLAAAGSIFGKSKGGQASPHGIGGQLSGFHTLPEQVQNAYLQQFLPAAQGQFNQGGMQLAPFNASQEQALQGFGQNLAGLQGQLPGFTNLYNQELYNPYHQEQYNQNVNLPTEELINQQLGENQSALINAQRRGGTPGALFSSAFGGKLAQLQSEANKLKHLGRINAFQYGTGQGRESFNVGQQLRRQTLEDMLRSGTAYQAQQQAQLGLPQANINQFAQNLGAFPGSSMVQGQTTSQPNWLSKLGGTALQFLGGAQGGGLFGGGGGGSGGFGGGGSAPAAAPMPQYSFLGNTALNNPTYGNTGISLFR